MKKWLALVMAVCLLAGALVGCASPQGSSQETATVTRGDLTITVSVSGNLEMPRKTDLAFGTAGMVEKVIVNEGDKVSKGQTLAKLDACALELNVEMAQAQYDMAENKLMQTIYPHYSYTHASDLAGTGLALDEAQDNLERAQELLEQGKCEEAQTSLEQVKESLDKAQRKLQFKPQPLPLSVKLAELEVDAAEIALDMAKVELAKATITAPFAGVVTDVMINEGQQLSAMTYANPAICLIDLSEIKMDGEIDEIDIAKVKLEQEADITLDALPDKDVKGKITFISHAGTVQGGVVSYKATINLENPDEELRDGMSATAEIIVEQHKDVLLIPNRAIQGSSGNYWVEVVVGEQTEKRQVSLGVSDGTNTEVLSGSELREGELVVLPRVPQFPFMPFAG